MKINISKTLVVALLLLSTGQLSAQPVRIAVAANAQGLIKKLQTDFKKRTGLQTETIIGSSGKLTTQIKNGAPFDVFLSADTNFPEQLYTAGFGIKKPVVYALGSLIIFGDNKLDLNKWQNLLNTDLITKIAIANPKTAPYGRAAEEALTYYKLKEKVSVKLIYGESISQVNTYLQTGAVAIGFTTEAFVYEISNKSRFKWIRIDQKSYGPIAQGAILLTHAKGGRLAEATRFFDYLTSAAARKIISSNGYHLPHKRN
jgi:molybdate transport system substrate-binding protein